MVAPSFDEAWDHLWSDLVWHRTVAVVVDTDVPSDAAAAHEVLAEPIAKAFKDLARVDGLDARAVEGVLDRFRVDGLREKFLISRSEENGLDARVHARVAGLLCECTLAATGESVSVPLEPIDSWGAGPLRFQKVVTLGDRIRILGSAGPGRSADRRVEWSPVKELPLDELFR